MNDMKDKILSFIGKDFKIELSYKMSFLMRIVGIFFSLSIWFFLARWVEKGIGNSIDLNFNYSYFAFILVGIASSEFQNSGLRGFSDKLRQNQVTGTLEALLVTPTNAFLILWGSTLWEFIYSFINSVLFICIGIIFFGVKISISSIGGILLALILSYMAFSSIGILSSSFILVYKKGDPINLAISSLSLLLAGIYYPQTILPDYLKLLAKLLPITHFLKIMRGLLLEGASIYEYADSYLYLLLFLIIFLPVSMIIFYFAYKIARIKGTLSYY
jgi:ABC-2 type transport system permease protein